MTDADEDYDDFDEALENALEGEPEQGPGLPQGLLPTERTPSVAGKPETASEPRIEDANEQAKDEDTNIEDRAKARQAIMSMMTEQQLDQYEAYRRSSLNRKSMRKVGTMYD